MTGIHSLSLSDNFLLTLFQVKFINIDEVTMWKVVFVVLDGILTGELRAAVKLRSGRYGRVDPDGTDEKESTINVTTYKYLLPRCI